MTEVESFKDMLLRIIRMKMSFYERFTDKKDFVNKFEILESFVGNMNTIENMVRALFKFYDDEPDEKFKEEYIFICCTLRQMNGDPK